MTPRPGVLLEECDPLLSSWHEYTCSRLRKILDEHSWADAYLVEVGQPFLMANKGLPLLEFLDGFEQHCREVAMQKD